MMQRGIWSILILLQFASSSLFAQQGKDGIKTISSSNVIVNEYTTLTADAPAGSLSIQVSNSSLNPNGLFAASLSTGDLIMIIQMQGATIKIAADSTYGEILNYNNCGNYEFCEVSGVPSSAAISFDCPLQHDYTASGKVQIVRVPRYSLLTINNGSTATCPGWDGSTGGIVAIEVSGNTVFSGTGKIDVSGKGFRGAILNENLTSYNVTAFYSMTGDFGAEKGEGIAGFETAYDTLGGRYCRGAAANGGGGGNAHNSGGGGGANGGVVSDYTGKGSPDTSVAGWITAWNLEFNGATSFSGSGGGRGGYSFSGASLNALVSGPNDTVWGGDNRHNNGGFGGRPLDYSIGKIFPGGGGGAGDQNNSAGGSGGNGGGLIYLMSYGTISGSGEFISNGSTGIGTAGGNGRDGAGGGGGGGTVILNSVDTITGISVTANGGHGGNQTLFLSNPEAEGPGAGGGGGYIAVSNGTISRTANGGGNGVTNSNSFTEFPSNGATKGGSGTSSAAITNFHLVGNDVIVCAGDAAALSAGVAGNAFAGIVFEWYDRITGGALLGTGNTFTTPPITSSTIYFVGTCPGMYRRAIRVYIDSVQANFSSATGSCPGIVTPFIATAASLLDTISSWIWDFGDGAGNSSMQNPVYAYSSSGSFNITLTVQDHLGCTAAVSQNIAIYPEPAIAFASGVASGCGQVVTAFSNNTVNGNMYLWNFGDGDTSTQVSPSHSYNLPGTYTVTLASVSVNGCASADSIINMITVNPVPVASFTASNACPGDTVQFLDSSNGNGSAIAGYDWDFGDSSGTSTTPLPYYFYSSPGNFIPRLVIVNAAGCTDTTTQSITIYALPDVNFGSSSQSACDSLTVYFSNSTSGAANYVWNFGDNTTSTLQIPSHLYTSPGTYMVSLTATSSNGCTQSRAVLNMISIYETPVVNFSTPVTTVCSADCINFNDSSAGTHSQWVWSFPGASPSSSVIQNPATICYAAPGNYPVTLTASNNFCSSSQTINNYIHVLNCSQPVANFIVSDTSVCSGSCLNFVNMSSNGTTFQWLFPGASPPASADINPSNICYPAAGNYDILLIASNPSATDTLFIPGFIRVFASPAIPNITQGADTLTATPAAGYQWYYNTIPISGTNQQQYVAVLSGNYSVEVTDSTGCTAISSPYYYSLVGIAHAGISNGFLIYPNPARDQLTIKIESGAKDQLKIKIENVLGEEIISKKVNLENGMNMFSIYTGSFSAGIYFVSIETPKGTIVQKVIKE